MDTTKYPIGVQTFEQLRKKNCVYADKTRYIYQLAHSGGTTFFLSRPRRFGKSLLLSTIEAYFSGKKELFEGLAIYDLEQQWESYPVLSFDFSKSQAKSAESLTEYITITLSGYERKYGITETSNIKDTGLRFAELIEKIHYATGKEVVILVDEYDKGIHEVLEDRAQLVANQEILRPFFSQIKAQGKYLRFCLITGVARFRNYTLFSGFNNPDDLSMESDYAGICGITKDELLNDFRSGIQALADKMDISIDDAIEQLRLKYDGYRFTESNELVFNPFSIINCLKKKQIDNFWIASGTSKVFIDYLSKSHFDLLKLEDLWVTKEQMEGIYSTEDPIPLLFQTGYLTIAEARRNMYRLRIPNGEVRSALVNDLIPHYMGVEKNNFSKLTINLMDSIESGDVDGFITVLQAIVAHITHHQMDIENLERTYHLVIYELFLIIGVDAQSEVSMSGGRIDLVIETRNYVYVIEFKLGGTVEEALKQIDDRGYSLVWRADGRHVYKVGVVFSPTTRTIASWKSVSDK